MTTRSIRIPEELDARLVAFAAANHISVNSAIVRTVENALDRFAQETAIAEAANDVFARRGELFRRLADA
jgi:predicted transcriptional regulator